MANEELRGPHGFARKALVAVMIATGVVLGLLFIWRLAYVLSLVFAGVLVALALDGLAGQVRRWMSMPRIVAVLVVLLLALALATGVGWLVGPDIVDQFERLEDTVPTAIQNLRERIASTDVGRRLMSRLPSLGELTANGGGTAIFGQLAGFFATFFGVVAGTVLVVTVGIYSAISPHLYVNAALRLLPPARRARAREVLGELGHVLKRWLLGRIAAMTVVGVLTMVGLFIVGIPLALSLGLIAGGLSFVPFIGPVSSAIPAVLVAFLEGPSAVLAVLVVFVAVQLVESNIITPLIEKRAVSLPPAMVIAVQFLMGSLLGIVGILLATPLAVVVTVVVQMVYIEDVLGDRVTLLGR